MKIISFAHTTPALLAGAKTVTRREWADRYARSFHAGDYLQAWDRAPRTGKGKRVATIRLTADPVEEMSNLYLRDYEAEGFAWLRAKLGLADAVAAIERDWTVNVRPLWVVRFEVVEVAG